MHPESQQRKSSPPPENKRKSFKNLVHDFTEYTTAHGIGRLGASETIFWKIFWSLACIGAFAMFTYQFIGLFQQYLSKPVSTSVSVTFEKRLLFPAVTVCNLNMLRQDRMPDEVKKILKNKLDYSVTTESTDDSEKKSRKRRRRDNPTDNSTATPTDKPTDNTTATPTDKPTDNTTDTSTDKPTDNTTDTPTDKPTNIQSKIPTNKPGDKSTVQQRDKPTDSVKDDSGKDDSGKDDSGKDDPYSDDYYDDEYYYDDYYYDYNDYYDDEKEEFPDVNELSAETRLRIEIERVVAGLYESDLYYDGHMFEDFIRNCSWKGFDCKSGNFSKFWTHQWNYKYGNCYTFNGGRDVDGFPLRVLKATKPGPSQGLLLEINVEQEEYIGPLSKEAGVRVLLHDPGQMTFPYEEGFSVSTGSATSVGLKKTQIIRLDRFNNKSCLPQDQLPLSNIYRRYKNITVYSQQACLNSCLGLSQRIRCNCSEDSFPSDRAPCDIFHTKTSKCLRIVKHLYNNDKLSCLSDCRQPCKEEVIQKTISSSQWPSKAYKEYLVAQHEYENESDNFLQLNVFFNELNYEQIEEQFSYGTINLLADIGGQLGLWIGISAITCCEVLELIIMFFAVCVKKFNNANKVHDVPRAWGND